MVVGEARQQIAQLQEEALAWGVGVGVHVEGRREPIVEVAMWLTEFAWAGPPEVGPQTIPEVGPQPNAEVVRFSFSEVARFSV